MIQVFINTSYLFKNSTVLHAPEVWHVVIDLSIFLLLESVLQEIELALRAYSTTSVALVSLLKLCTGKSKESAKLKMLI